MKKYLYLFLTAVCVLALTACNDEDDPMAPTLEIVKSDIGFDAAGGNGTITLKSSAETLKAVSDKSWLTITGIKAATISYTVAESGVALQRSANITVTAGNQSCSVTILQNGAMFEMDAEPIAVDPEGQKPTLIPFQTSMQSAPKIDIKADAVWLHASVENGSIRLLGDTNVDQPRSTVVTVTQGWKPIEITVSQEMVDLIDITSLELEREGIENKVITATQYLALISQDWEVRTAANWIELSQTGQESFAVTVGENTSGAMRRGSIELVNKSDNKVIATVSVSQKSYSYAFFLGDWTMNSSEGAIKVTFRAKETGKSYFMDGLALNNVIIGYDDSGSAPKLTLNMQIMGYTGEFYVVLCPRSDAGNYTWMEGSGLDLVYNMKENDQILNVRDNGAWKDNTAGGFGFYAFSDIPPSSSTSLGYIVRYPSMTTFTRSTN